MFPGFFFPAQTTLSLEREERQSELEELAAMEAALAEARADAARAARVADRAREEVRSEMLKNKYTMKLVGNMDST